MPAREGCDGLVILTSACLPKIAPRCRHVQILPWMDAKRPEFYFPDEADPSSDWAYQKNQTMPPRRRG